MTAVEEILDMMDISSSYEEFMAWISQNKTRLLTKAKLEELDSNYQSIDPQTARRRILDAYRAGEYDGMQTSLSQRMYIDEYQYYENTAL